MKVFADGDRVSHASKGLGTVVTKPAQDDVEIDAAVAAQAGPDTVFVAWDDDTLPVQAVPRRELEKLSDAEAAISTGF